MTNEGVEMERLLQEMTDRGWFDRMAEDIHPDQINSACDAFGSMVIQMDNLQREVNDLKAAIRGALPLLSSPNPVDEVRAYSILQQALGDDE